MTFMCETLQWILGYLVLPFSVSAYASVVVSRIWQFYDAKKDAWQVIIAMEDKLSPKSKTLEDPWASARLNGPAQQIRYFGHRAAASEIDSIAADIAKALEAAREKLKVTPETVEIPRREWERRIVSLRFSWPTVFKPWLNTNKL